MQNQTLTLWRTLLFIPANNARFVAKAHTRGADGIILDLEDSIAPDQKSHARQGLAAAAQQVSKNGSAVLVRINAESWQEDIDAACTQAVSALVIPKVNEASSLVNAAQLLDQLESERNLPLGAIRLLAQIEDVQALPQLDAIASSTPRLLGMSLGSEDFSASAGMLPMPETLYHPNQQVAFACRRAGILPFGFPASITLFNDLEALSIAANQAANMGFVGAFCIHPNQVAVLNQALTPSAGALADARALLDEFSQAQQRGQAVFAFKGKMVDLPVIIRARELVARAQAIAGKNLA
ncbi:MAG: CoA ester lyase [Spongiibacteraceae bacterium]|nr:CoA ester lyase [Spongiibacteraceae bacterium]